MKVKKTPKVAHETGCCCRRLARKEEIRKPNEERRPRGGARSQGAWLTRCRRRPLSRAGKKGTGSERLSDRVSKEEGAREGGTARKQGRMRGRVTAGAPTAEPTLQPGARSIAGRQNTADWKRLVCSLNLA